MSFVNWDWEASIVIKNTVRKVSQNTFSTHTQHACFCDQGQSQENLDHSKNLSDCKICYCALSETDTIMLVTYCHLFLSMVDSPPTEQVLLECLQVKQGKHHIQTSVFHSSFLPVTTSQCAQAYQTELAIDRTSVKAEERNVFIIIYVFIILQYCTAHPLLRTISYLISARALKNGGFFFTVGPCHGSKSSFLQKRMW